MIKHLAVKLKLNVSTYHSNRDIQALRMHRGLQTEALVAVSVHKRAPRCQHIADVFMLICPRLFNQPGLQGGQWTRAFSPWLISLPLYCTRVRQRFYCLLLWSMTQLVEVALTGSASLHPSLPSSKAGAQSAAANVFSVSLPPSQNSFIITSHSGKSWVHFQTHVTTHGRCGLEQM